MQTTKITFPLTSDSEGTEGTVFVSGQFIIHSRSKDNKII
jgi:hypothetical protein